MLDGNDCRHAVSHIRSGEIQILFLQDAQLSRVGVDDIGEHGLKAGQMGASLRVIDIVAEAQHIFMKFIHVLKSDFHGNAFALAGKINDVAHRLSGLVQIPDKAHDSLRLVIFDHLRLILSLIRENNGERRVQIGRLMQTALNLILLEAGFFENLTIRQKIDAGSRIFCLSHHGKQAVHKLHGGNAPLIPVLIDFAVMPHPHGKPCGKGVYHGGAHAVQAAAGLIGGMVKFSSRMQGGKYQTLRAHAFFVHAHGNTPAVIIHCGRSVRFQRYTDFITYACQMLVHRIVYNLINQMVQSLRGNASDIHARPFPDRFKPLQHCNAGSIVSVLTAHFPLHSGA